MNTAGTDDRTKTHEMSNIIIVGQTNRLARIILLNFFFFFYTYVEISISTTGKTVDNGHYRDHINLHVISRRTVRKKKNLLPVVTSLIIHLL